MVNNSLFTYDWFNIREAFTHCSDSEIAECVRKGFLPNVLTCLHHLDNIRKLFGSPIVVSSCYRSVEHNTRVGGVSTSQHLKGSAIDFYPQTIKGRFMLSETSNLLKLCHEYNKDSQCIGQLIGYGTFIHLGLLDTSVPSCSYYHIINKCHGYDMENVIKELQNELP